MIHKNSILIASNDQVSADLAPETSENMVVLSLADGIYYELKDVAARVWSLVQQPRPFQTVLDKILEEYDVDPARCENDLLALAEDLNRRGLLEITPNPASQASDFCKSQ
ncbi:MAG TPA: PqqD family protein [Candidatus Competibacteraceae bacterium]|nr:PqqD family protein [Candidatus Competibacteraceae bacterium]